jgi:hypothetical protein
MMGRPPAGPAKAGSIVSGLAAEQIMLAGASTFVCLLQEEERKALEAAEGMASLEADLRFLHKSTRGTLLATALDRENNFQSLESEIATLRARRAPQVTLREKAVKLRKAQAQLEEAKAAVDKVPLNFHWVECSMPKGQPGSLDSLMRLVYDLEARIRRGERLYVFSADGHGRVGMVCSVLLGRLYALPVEEALERVQLYHDCSKVLCGLGTFGRGCSCPADWKQAQQVRAALQLRESEYQPLITVMGQPIDRTRRRLVQGRRRREGYPEYLQEVLSIELEESSMSSLPSSTVPQVNGDGVENKQEQGLVGSPKAGLDSTDSEGDETEGDQDEIFNIWSA